LGRVVHHVSGDRSGAELLSMRTLDAAVHAWDLARAIGADAALADGLVAFLLDYTGELDLGASPAAFAPPSPDLSPHHSAQDQLLQRLGRRPGSTREDR
jgi:hypothetical protein